jgi:allantoinase
MGVALHPYITGQPFRLRELRRALAHVATARDSVWFTTAGAIAQAAAGVAV